MHPKIRFVRKESIELGTQVLLADYGRKYGEIFKPPIPVEEILEAHLEIDFWFDDLPVLLEMPDVLGATWFKQREVRIDQSLDPSVHPAQLGRYRFTVAHEVGHWDLHREIFLSDKSQVTLFGVREEPIVCRSNDRRPLEWQADSFAGFLLMPKKMVFAAWETLQGSLQPYVAIGEIDDIKAKWGLENHEFATVDIARQMAQVFEVSAQAMQIRLIELGLIRTQIPEPSLFSV